ncbi:hypothetical protein P3X46_009788 [Hevea brasiliensis]|uniref:BAG domain-containing protein n=1 Tax=Hevea brasiliensis TaxID=3981 RepID=A0ABQ9MMY6_HEVBR|nr:hypothetical protein P3X46_009788 [Hevea brasiliensis]
MSEDMWGCCNMMSPEGASSDKNVISSASTGQTPCPQPPFDPHAGPSSPSSSVVSVPQDELWAALDKRPDSITSNRIFQAPSPGVPAEVFEVSPSPDQEAQLQAAPSLLAVEHRISEVLSSFNRITMRSDILSSVYDKLGLKTASSQKLHHLMNQLDILEHSEGDERPKTGAKAAQKLIEVINDWCKQNPGQ